MTEARLSAAEIARMQTPLWTQAVEAIDRGDPDAAKSAIDRAVAQTRSLQEYSISWITSLLTFVAEELGEEAVERALRKSGEEFVRPRRDRGVPWESLPAPARAKVIARAMVANGGTVEVDEDDEEIVLAFHCGSGGWLLDEGAYEGEHAFATLREPAGRTFMREELPVYCAHCAVNNEIQPVEWGGVPTSIEHPPTGPGEPCIHRIPRRPRPVSADALDRLGLGPTPAEGAAPDR